MLLCQPMARNPSGRRSVLFHHLGCACRHVVASPIAEVLHVDTASAAVVRAALRVQGHEENGWFARAIRTNSRDQFSNALASYVELSKQTEKAPQLDAKGWAGLIGPRQGRTESAVSATPLDMHCNKCGSDIHRTPTQLVGAAQKHPGQRQAGGPLVAYLADRGEVVYRIDEYAEQLAIRDRRAQRAVRRRMGAIGTRGGAAMADWILELTSL